MRMQGSNQSTSAQGFSRVIFAHCQPFFTENGEVIVTASVGISLLAQGGEGPVPSAYQAIQQAESAMFEAKRRGRDAVMLFDTQITRRAQQRISLQSSLRKAVVNQEFDLYLQPQVSIHDGSVVGGEVLLRWIHSGQAMHTPADFIPILEASGMIVRGQTVVRILTRSRACFFFFLAATTYSTKTELTGLFFFFFLTLWDIL